MIGDKTMKYKVKDLNSVFCTHDLEEAKEHAKENLSMRYSWEITGWWQDSMSQVLDEAGSIIFDAAKG